MILDNKPFLVLSLDGGGVRGYLTAKILYLIEQYLNEKTGETEPLGQRFDFIVGTSTGGLIALGLSIGKTAGELVEFYEKKASSIFSNASCTMSQMFSPKYSNKNLKNAVEEILQENTLKDVLTDVCITSVSLKDSRPKFHKSDYITRNQERLDEKLTDIAMATSAAPTYFESYSTKYSSDLIDGGICANNPSVIGLVDAFEFDRNSKRGVEKLDVFPRDKDRIVLLSVGTGKQSVMPYDYNNLLNAGRIRWGYSLWKIILESQSELVHKQVKFLLGDSYRRINPLLPCELNLDDLDSIKKLKNLYDLDKDTSCFLDNYFI